MGSGRVKDERIRRCDPDQRNGLNLKKDNFMKEWVTLELEDDTVRFTPDGRIAVIDAIGALSETDCPVCVWEDLKRRHPRVADLCVNYAFLEIEDEDVPVADSRSWMVIQSLLLDHLIDSES
jgi:hypothetical protein